MSHDIGIDGVAIAPTFEVPASFVSGTRLRTTRGEISVEDLNVGDFVTTAEGNTCAIINIGSWTIYKPARDHCPVQIKAYAFPGDVPRRDLQLSPGHLVCVRAMDDVLIPVRQLINGATVTSVDIDEVIYWHIGLASHEVVLVEGLGCESCLDYGTPSSARTAAIVDEYARPLVKDGAVVAVIRQRLHSRAESMGWHHDKEMDPHLIVDGRRLEPTIDDHLATFIFAADAKDVVLASRVWVPADDGVSRDRRTLGLSVHGLAIFDGLRVDRQISLDGIADFYPEEAAERCTWRWTNGWLSLLPHLWEDCHGPVILRFAFDPAAGRSWVPPGQPCRQFR